MKPPVRRLVLTAGLLTAATAWAVAHDMFLKPDRFFVAENASIDLALINGTFTKSENSIARNRIDSASTGG